VSETLQSLKEQIDGCTEEEKRNLLGYLKKTAGPHPLEAEWGIDAETILSAIQRGSDLTKRGVRGIIAEAVFMKSVVLGLEKSGWNLGAMPAGDLSYDALLCKEEQKVRIQIKLQRLEKGCPKLYYPKKISEELYVVEVQKTRSGKKKSNSGESGDKSTESTRPYRFGDFDILAVNMHPSTHDWARFQYTVANWLIPREGEEHLIEIFQPVRLVPGTTWTNDLSACLAWFQSGREQRILDMDRVPRVHRRREPGKE